VYNRKASKSDSRGYLLPEESRSSAGQGAG